MRALCISLVYLLPIGLFLCLTPALAVIIGYLLDSFLKLRKLSFGSVSLVLAGLLVSFALFWAAWSWYGLPTVGKDHPQNAFGVSLAPVTLRFIPTTPFLYIRDSVVFGHLAAFSGAGRIWGFVGASLITSLIGGILMACCLNVFEERKLKEMFGKKHIRYGRDGPLWISRFSREIKTRESG